MWGLHRDHKVCHGGGGLPGWAPRAGVPIWPIRATGLSPEKRRYPQQAECGEFGERKCPSPRNPRAVIYQCLLAATSCPRQCSAGLGACHWAGCSGKAPPSACGWGVNQGLEPLPKSPSSTSDTVGPSVHHRRGQAWTNAIGCRAPVVPHQAPNPGAHFTRSARPEAMGQTRAGPNTPSHPIPPIWPSARLPIGTGAPRGQAWGPLPDEPNPQHV